MRDDKSLSHTRWDCKYHIVFIPKKRQKLIFGLIRKHLGSTFHELAERKGIVIEEGHLKFNVTRPAVASGLLSLVADADSVQQGKLNLCGPAATLRCVLRRDPKLVAEFIIGLVENGKGRFGTRLVEPGSDLRNQTFDASWGPNAAEWVGLSSLRDDENWLIDFEGTPKDTVSGVTTPGEVKDWLNETGLYSSVRDEANLVITENAAHAAGLSFNNNTDNVLLIHAHLLRSASATNKKSDNFILRAFPNHFVVLASEVLRDSGRVTLDVWSWGDIYTIDVPEDTFEANYYGAVIAKV